MNVWRDAVLLVVLGGCATQPPVRRMRDILAQPELRTLLAKPSTASAEFEAVARWVSPTDIASTSVLTERVVRSVCWVWG